MAVVGATLASAELVSVPRRRPWTSTQWREYFRRNAASLMPIAWETGVTFTPEERGAVVGSMQQFQLGESSDGRRFMAMAYEYAHASGDRQYLSALRRLIAEEQRHGRDLGRVLELAGAPTIGRCWADSVFRWLRHTAGLERSIWVLVTAEVIAQVYYDALRDATASLVLRQLCTQILRDEDAHVRFQCERLAILRRQRKPWSVALRHALYRAFFGGVCVAFWWKHAAAMRKGGYGFVAFWRSAWRQGRIAMRLMDPRHYDFTQSSERVRGQEGVAGRVEQPLASARGCGGRAETARREPRPPVMGKLFVRGGGRTRLTWTSPGVGLSFDTFQPWLGVVGVLVAARVLLAGVCWHARRFRPSSELSRKALHVGMGTLFMSCPWLFDRAWPVFVLAGCFVGLLLARHVFPPLRRQVEGVIYGVRRASVGEFYFPVAAALLFAVSGGEAASYCIPLGLMAYADAAAAVVGRRYGAWRYRTVGGVKSLEGSAAFCAVAYVFVHAATAARGPVEGRVATILVAINVAMAGTWLEAVVGFGLDNLAVPLGAFLVLKAASLITHSPGMLMIGAAAQLAGLGLTVAWGRLAVTAAERDPRATFTIQTSSG